MRKWLQGTPLLQRGVLELVEQEVPYPLVESIAQVVSVPSRVGPAQQGGDVVESVRPDAALGPGERGFQEFGQATQRLSLVVELGSEIDSGQPDRLTKKPRQTREGWACC